jgi:hypothetical protein
MPTKDIKSAASGMAALAICESLLLALIDGKVLAPLEVSGLLADAAAAHPNAPQVVALIRSDQKICFGSRTLFAHVATNVTRFSSTVRHRLAGAAAHSC